MYHFRAFVRRSLNRLALTVLDVLYPVTGRKRRRWLFEKSVKITPLNTGVEVLSRDGDCIKIAKKRPDGSFSDAPFRILTTTDIHMGDDPALRRKSVQMLANHIVSHKPDLVIFTGDIILGKYQQLDVTQLARFMEKTGVYWAITFGNHETREDKGFFKWFMLDTAAHYPHCLAVHGDSSLFGYGNYEIDVMADEKTVKQALFLLDSGRDMRDDYSKLYGTPEGMKGYDFLKPCQIEWYEKRIELMKSAYNDAKSLMYFHIPLPEFDVVMRLNADGRYVPTGEAELEYGCMYESVGCSPYNSGMFETILRLGSTQAVFCGHDHVNAFSAIYRGVRLVYNQYDGYETYTPDVMGLKSEKDWMQGVTLTDIAPDGSIRVYPRYNSDYLK